VDVKIRRLAPRDAPAIVACFRRVYGESYANGLFYDPARLATAIAEGRIGSVGAESSGRLLAHMAMTVHPGARHVELGNTVVDPDARGQGLAWQVGAELKAWCVALGYAGYLHYPTTAHHVMQQQSVRRGFETGLMLGYIPAQTDGQTGTRTGGRQAATIVYEALAESAAMQAQACYLPEVAAELVVHLARPTGLGRRWRAPVQPAADRSRMHLTEHARRALARLTVERVGADLADRLQDLEQFGQHPCRQIDFHMDDPGIGAGVAEAMSAGFWFCGWLPGYASTDVLRLQQVDRAVTEMTPNLVNPVARDLLNLVP
jgi:GNAT superfamily N-acetyltransferase